MPRKSHTGWLGRLEFQPGDGGIKIRPFLLISQSVFRKKRQYRLLSNQELTREFGTCRRFEINSLAGAAGFELLDIDLPTGLCWIIWETRSENSEMNSDCFRRLTAWSSGQSVPASKADICDVR